ncbi:hypothetical protein FVEG_16802 [Fusarium verticillioides 7600]|uniref:Uncharacterized protein n=1 Tax=Gibberella moniliformis (strain M3125 / FGSC 7600) TaxID=334819 RepID=W7MUZ3_GIBM7|nr:hypothetical protein FVEG_16802 [Fusarium verticillioides 7600]XP_018757676.1 hypothetical protein FVEG_16802 [Fusarium verticillioides 7600]EWG51484.1 hypothetical protein FVEG_16802 [Fusarium verticillioides 7600]EWG51485.1 hypothetical protein FVEG_16802 [Fusarium verticillioides 7600]
MAAYRNMTNATLILTRCPSLVSNSNRAHWTMGAMICSSLTRSESSFGIPPPSKSIDRYILDHAIPCHAILAKTKEPRKKSQASNCSTTAISPKARMSVLIKVQLLHHILAPRVSGRRDNLKGSTLSWRLLALDQ